MKEIIALINQKGGVGKTTSCISIAGALSELGFRVLAVDMDPQGNLGRGLGIDTSLFKKTIYELFTDQVDIKKVIKPTSTALVQVLPSTFRLTKMEDVVEESSMMYILKDKLKEVEDNYDYILIDCPPSLGTLSILGMVAATKIIIPIQCEYFAFDALTPTLSTISRVQKNYNPDLEILGLLFTMYDARTTLSSMITMELRKIFKDKTFVTEIPRNASISEASYYGLPVTSYKPKASGSVAYFSVTKEIINRLKEENDESR